MAKRRRLHEGEIACTVESTGRRVTLDPIKQHQVTVMLNQVESLIPCGFKSLWLSGEKDGNKFELTSGAGVGSKWMTFDYCGKQYTIDGQQLLEAIFDAVEQEPQ